MKILTTIQLSKKYTPALLLLFILAACATPPDYPIEPIIEFQSLSKDTLQRGDLQTDFTFATFSFTDGDGDIGSQDSILMYFTDNRDGAVTKFRVPRVTDVGTSNGIKGTITTRIFTSCCKSFPPDLFLDPCNATYDLLPYDKVVYDIYMEDRAGNQSNVIQAAPIYIRCF